MVGLSHHHAPIELRERLAFSKEQVREALGQLQKQFPKIETVLLSTCNRVELYAASKDAKAFPDEDELGRFLSEFHQADYQSVAEQLTKISGPEAIKHLFMVASSLDSMIIGEAQILSQVKEAYEIACQGETASALMHQAFQRAASVAKRVATETEIHKRRISVPSVAVSEIATEFFERFDDKRILLIGAGEMGTETLKYLIDAGAKSVQIVNRSRQRAEELAAEFSATVGDWDDLDSEIGKSDLIVSTTGATEPIMTQQRFKKIRSRRSVLILDLAVPRDFEASIAELSDVYLFTVDDLQEVCDRNVLARRQQWPKAERIIDAEVDKFLGESTHRGSGATIKKLREQAEATKRSELERLMNKLDAYELDDKAKKELTMSFDRLVNKLLHPPLQALRENADSQHHDTLLDSLRRLFKIND